MLAFLEYLTTQGVSIHMLGNFVSVKMPKFIMCDLDHTVAEHHNVRFLKSDV